MWISPYEMRVEDCPPYRVMVVEYQIELLLMVFP